MNSSEASLYSKNRRMMEAGYRMYLHKYMSINDNDKILDFGCGTGELVYRLSKEAKLAFGFDKSKEMIEFARQIHKATNVSYEIADISNCLETHPHWKGKFSKIVSAYVLHWVKNKRQVFQNIYDCLSEGGECFILYVGPNNQLRGNNDDELPYYLKNHIKWKHHLKGYENKYYSLTLKENVSLLKSVGFGEVKGHLHTPCDEHDIFSKDELRGCVSSLVDQIEYVPEQYRSEILQDATEWCFKNFPVNSRGNKYIRHDTLVLLAKKN
ncbi:juvenile hormone acid O-methyltransferase-like [Antedon mediterranea]|uniref:juvenile hormone acid O-methyltransferase-like n=1 Tax=Antedon mediterranea TaxID=105859 RepID=UPI003AF503B4